MKPPRKVFVLNGPNLNMLGLRETDVYGTDTLEDLEEQLVAAGKELSGGLDLLFFQSNYEGEMIECVQQIAIEAMQSNTVAGVIINPGGWTHTSIALRDALAILPAVLIAEVHISNLAEREEFRQFSYIEDLADLRIMGRGIGGYVEALRWIAGEIQKIPADVH